MSDNKTLPGLKIVKKIWKWQQKVPLWTGALTMVFQIDTNYGNRRVYYFLRLYFVKKQKNINVKCYYVILVTEVYNFSIHGHYHLLKKSFNQLLEKH